MDCQPTGTTNYPPPLGERRLLPPLYKCLAKPGKVSPWQILHILAPESARNFLGASMETCLEHTSIGHWSHNHTAASLTPN